MIKVKVFDYEHEKDLEKEINFFLGRMSEDQLIDIKYNIAAIGEEIDKQVYCFSAMVIYRT
ncbi:MAG: sporulation protein Cse60 [Bacillus sp. (in: firmicutes)]